MPRSQEAIRQWQVLRSIAGSKLGVTVQRLAADQRVTPRTIRRDLAALQEAGFPLYQEKRDTHTTWKVDARCLQGLHSGFTLIELCALYFSRATLECVAAAPFHAELASAFARFEAAAPPAMRRFLDRVPAVVGAKRATGVKRADGTQRERVAQLLDASLHRRKVRMRYRSLTSGRTKDYDLDPYRVVYAEGGLYLRAYVSEYGEMRTFAIERIERLALRDEHFAELEAPADAFGHSLGVHSGPPEYVKIEFDSHAAAHVAEREWHSSQQITTQPDGNIHVEMCVCIDLALRRWVLGFGSHARVIAPSELAEELLDEFDAARANYASQLDLDLPRVAWDLTSQRILPFMEVRRPS